MIRALTGRYRFVFKSIIRTAVFFLIGTMIWTLLSEALIVAKDIFYFKHWPLITNFQLACDENDPNSPLFKNEKNADNEYVTKSSKRYDLNIHEATKETLSTINIQVAVWIVMASDIEIMKTNYGKALNVTVTNEMLGLEPDEFTVLTSSTIFTSLMAGIVSLTFAQYKLYMTRHEKGSVDLLSHFTKVKCDSWT